MFHKNQHRNHNSTNYCSKWHPALYSSQDQSSPRGRHKKKVIGGESSERNRRWYTQGTLENALKSKRISKEIRWMDRHCQGQAEVETADSLHSQTFWCLMAEGHLESKWLQLHYAKGHSVQSDLFWRLHFSVATRHSGVSLYLGSTNSTRPDKEVGMCVSLPVCLGPSGPVSKFHVRYILHLQYIPCPQSECRTTAPVRYQGKASGE